jgi:hypothetical protein
MERENAMIRCQCTNCGKSFQVRDVFAGKAARCTRCQKVFRVPALEEDVVLEVVDDNETAQSDSARRELQLRPLKEETSQRASRRPLIPEVQVLPADPDGGSLPSAGMQDEEDQPRRKKGKKRKRQLQPSLGTVMGIGAGLLALWLLTGVLGFFFKPAGYGMLVLGILLFSAGRRSILRQAANEGTGQYICCLLVPFYDTWFTYSRLTKTWAPCLICWAGRAFSLAAGILLLVHFLHTELPEGLDVVRAESPREQAVASDAQCEKLLAAPNKAEAQSWLQEPNKGRGFFKWGRQGPLKFVNELYERGAKEVTVADIEPNPLGNGEFGTHLIVTLPSEPEKRKAVLELINERFADDDEPHTDHGQRYELLTPD